MSFASLRSVRTAAAALLTLPPAAAAEEYKPLKEPDRRETVVKFGNDPWKILSADIRDGRDPTADLKSMRRWHDVITALHVSDDTKIRGMIPMRMEILDLGAKSSHVPPEVVQTTLYTNLVLANELAKENEMLREFARGSDERAAELRAAGANGDNPCVAEALRVKARAEQEIAENEKLLALIATSCKPYLWKTIVDTRDVDGNPHRLLIDAKDEVPPADWREVRRYSDTDFPELAACTMAAAADKKLLEQYGRTLLSSGENTVARDRLMEMFLECRPDAVPQEVINQARVWLLAKGLHIAVTNAPKVPPSGLIGKEEQLPFLNGVPKIHPSLIAHPMPSPYLKAGQDRFHLAKCLLLLARAGDPSATGMCAQWFAHRPYGIGTKDAPEARAEVFAVEALAICAGRKGWDPVALRNWAGAHTGLLRAGINALAAQSSEFDRAHEVFRKVAATHPRLVWEMAVAGTHARASEERRRVGTAVLDALRSRPEESKKWLLALAEGKAPLLIADTIPDTHLELVAKIRSEGIDVGRRMTVLDSRAQSTEYKNLYKKILAADDEPMKHVLLAAAGAAVAGDRSAIPHLLTRAAGKGTSEEDLLEFIKALLEIDKLDDGFGEEKTAIELSFGQYKNFIPEYSDTDGQPLDESKVVGAFRTMERGTTFHAGVHSEVGRWLASQRGDTEITPLGSPISRDDSPESRFVVFQRALGSNGPASNGALRDAVRTDPVAAEAAARLMEYLRDSVKLKRGLDTATFVGLLKIAGRLGDQSTRDIFLKIAKAPESFGPLSKKDAPNNAKALGIRAMLLKLAALEGLGGIASLTDTSDEATRILHINARRSTFPPMRRAATIGLQTISDRQEFALMQNPTDDEREKIAQARQFHAEKTLGHLDYYSRPRGLNETQVIKLQIELAAVAKAFGGTESLVTHISRILPDPGDQKADMKSDLRTEGVQALLLAAMDGDVAKACDDQEMDGDQKDRILEMLGFLKNQEYLKHAKPAHRPNFAVAMLDGGFARGPGIIHPVEIPKSAIAGDRSEHPMMVAAAMRAVTPERTILSDSFAYAAPHRRFGVDVTDLGAFRAAERVIQHLILNPELRLGGINHSYGTAPGQFHVRDLRRLADAKASGLSLLGEFATNVVADGNEGQESPDTHWYGPHQDGVLTGSRWNTDGTVEQPDSTIYARAWDKIHGRLAAFASEGSLDDAPRVSIATPGTKEPLKAGQQRKFYDGSSVAAPYLTEYATLVVEEGYMRGVWIKPAEVRMILNAACEKDRDGVDVLRPRKIYDEIDRYMSKRGK